MKIQALQVGSIGTNCYILCDEAAKVCAVIDPGAEPELILSAAEKLDCTVDKILLTHGHYDHVGAVAALKKATGCKVYMDPVDAQGSQLLPLTPDVLTDNWPANDELTIDELTFKIYHTPGHTGGGVCLSCYGLMFSGDTLFAGSCGRRAIFQDSLPCRRNRIVSVQRWLCASTKSLPCGRFSVFSASGKNSRAVCSAS